MKTGYSLLLRQYVQADEVDHGDCESFQVTCPACREAIFKAGSDGGRQYLSHYAASKSEVATCELRVASTGMKEIAEHNAMARGQALESFLGVFRTEALNHFIKPHARTSIESRLAAMSQRPSYRAFIRDVRDISRQMDTKKQLEVGLFSADAVAPIYPNMSSYWRNRQSGFALDLLRHLLSSHAFQNLSLALSIGVIHQLGVIHEHGASGPDTEDVVKGLRVLWNGSERELAELLADTRGTEAGFMLTTAALQCLAAVVLEFPYIEVLKRHLAKG